LSTQRNLDVLKTFISAVPEHQISLNNDVVLEECADTDLDFLDLPYNVLVSAVEGIEQRHQMSVQARAQNFNLNNCVVHIHDNYYN
jgi:hypothetical protein